MRALRKAQEDLAVDQKNLDEQCRFFESLKDIVPEIKEYVRDQRELCTKLNQKLRYLRWRLTNSDEDIKYTLKVYRDVLPILKNAVDEQNVKGYLKGEPVEPVFRKISNFNTKPVRKGIK